MLMIDDETYRCEQEQNEHCPQTRHEEEELASCWPLLRGPFTSKLDGIKTDQRRDPSDGVQSYSMQVGEDVDEDDVRSIARWYASHS